MPVDRQPTVSDPEDVAIEPDEFDGIEDTDAIADVISNVPGITDVVDETTVSAG